MVFKVGQEDTTTAANRSYDRKYHERLPARSLSARSRTDRDFPSIKAMPPHTNFRNIISQVCRHWRDVALETPGLWTTISLARPTKRSLESAALCFRRSGQLPLDVRVKISPLGLNGEFLQALRSQLYRVRVLVLVFCNHRQPQAVLSDLFPAQQHFEMCRLETFHCTSTVLWAAVEPWSTTPLAALRAPKIKSFLVVPDSARVIRFFLPSSFENITRMDIGFSYSPTEEDLRPLSQCCKLRSLSWCHTTCPLPNSLPFDFNFHHLRSLSVLLRTQESCLAVSQHFHTPMLEQLYVQMGSTYDYDIGDLVWIVPFLRRNSQLKRLMIDHAKAHDDMTDVFTQLTHLTTFKLFNYDLSKSFVETFLKEVDGRLILPNMRFFEFSASYSDDTPMSYEFVEVVRSRLTDDEKACATIVLSNFQAWEDEWEELNMLEKEYGGWKLFIDNMRVLKYSKSDEW